MFIKEIEFELNADNTEVLTPELEKTASFTLPQGVNYDEEYLYLIVRAVSAGEYWGCNKNKDYFPEAELKANYRTFLAAHVFKNHENKQIENAIGDVLQAEYDDNMHCVKLLLRIDKKLAPSITRGFERGIMTDVSMGCRIQYSICSICGNKAKTKMDYCDHIRQESGRVYPDGRMVYEINIAPKFHDISVVLNGAERSAKVIDMKLNREGESKVRPLSRVAAVEYDYGLEKVAADSMQPKFPAPFYTPDIGLPHLRKEASIKKLADIEKEIKGRVIADSAKDYYKNKIYDAAKKVDDNGDKFHLLVTKFLDGRQCHAIGENLRDIAKSNGISTQKALAKFLEQADVMGVELSPMELHRIFSATADLPSTQNAAVVRVSASSIPGLTARLGTWSNLRGAPEFLGAMPSVIRSFSSFGDEPLGKAIMIVMKSRAPMTDSFGDNGAASDIGRRIISSILPQRSVMPLFARERLASIDTEHLPDIDKQAEEYYPLRLLAEPELIKTAEDLNAALSGLAWVAYENDRADRYGRDDYTELEQRVAMDLSETAIEKMAADGAGPGTVKKKSKMGLGKKLKIGSGAYGGTLLYSAFQRSRIRNGKNLSSFNRYIAENPDQAGMIAAMAAPAIVGGARSAGKAIAGTAGKIGDKAQKAGEFLAKNKGNIGKGTAVAAGLAAAGAGAAIAAKKLKERRDRKKMEKAWADWQARQGESSKEAMDSYSAEQMGALKYASVAMEMGREDMAQEMLQKWALSEEDQKIYLQNQKNAVIMEFEKDAACQDLIGGALYSEFGDDADILLDIGDVAELAAYILDE